MKKAYVCFVDHSGFAESPTSEHVLKFEDDVTDKDLLDEIGVIEDQTSMVCESWKWIAGTNDRLIVGTERG